MCYPIGVKLGQRRILALDTLYRHLFSTPGCNTTTINQLKHDLVLWLTPHSFEELPDALEYYLADPNSDLDGDLVHLTFLDPWGVQVHIHPLVTIYINTLLAWAKCFLATYGVYPGLYDLLDTPNRVLLAAQLNLRDSTLPRPLLHRYRGPPTIRSEYVAFQPLLGHPPHPIVCITVMRPIHPLTCQSVMRPVCLSSVCLSPRQSVALSVHPLDSLSVIPACLSYEQSITTRQSTTPPISPAKHQSDRPSPSDLLYTILPCPPGCCTSSDHTSIISTSPSDHPPPSHRLYDTPTSPSDHPPPSHHLYDTPTSPSDHAPPSHRLYDTPTSPSDHLPASHLLYNAPISPSSHEWGAITDNSLYTRFEPIPSSREWGAIPQGQEIP